MSCNISTITAEAVSSGLIGMNDPQKRALIVQLLCDIYGNGIPVSLTGSSTVGTTDGGASWTTVRTLVSSADISAAAVDASSAPTASQKIVLTDVIASADTDMRLDFTEETSGTVIVSVYMTANIPVQITTRGKLKLDTADKKLQVQSSASGNVRITTLTYSEA